MAPPECPNEHEVVSHVTSLAGETATAQPLRVWARIVRVPGDEPARWRLELRIGSESEAPRTLESNECHKLAEATAFIVALGLQSRAEPERTEAPAPAPPVAPTDGTIARTHTEPPARSAAVSPPRRTSTSSLHGALGSDLTADHGSFPSLAWGGGIFGYVGYGAFRGELGAALWPRSPATVTSPRGAGASITLRTVGVRGCWSPARVPWLDACLRAEVGVLNAAGFGIIRPMTSDGLWFTGLAGLTARPVSAGPLRPRATVELGSPLRYSAVTIDGIGQVYSPAPIVFRVAIGLESKLF
ncbi:MAG: hypothetical protein BGO98_15835 [Myxococcales bacterium 68-20]|nr:MAG: hypothetical protein BGO98_15835 [Myxococcales bacterium 68-20]